MRAPSTVIAPCARPGSTANAAAANKRTPSAVPKTRRIMDLFFFASVTSRPMRNALKLFGIALVASAAFAQTPNNDRDFEQVIKNADDVLWYFKVSDVASVDK